MTTVIIDVNNVDNVNVDVDNVDNIIKEDPNNKTCIYPIKILVIVGWLVYLTLWITGYILIGNSKTTSNVHNIIKTLDVLCNDPICHYTTNAKCTQLMQFVNRPAEEICISTFSISCRDICINAVMDLDYTKDTSEKDDLTTKKIGDWLLGIFLVIWFITTGCV